MEAPTHLAREGKQFFAAVADEYGEDFEPFEWQLLRLAAEALDRGAQSRRAIRRHGLTYLSPQGAPVARPEIAIEKASRAAFAQLVRQLGLGDIDDEHQDDQQSVPTARRGTSYTSTLRRRGAQTRATESASRGADR